MHELGMCTDIVDAVARRAGDRPVARVTVRVGALHRVVDDAFAQSFAVAATGSIAEGAVTELVHLPVLVRCDACGAESEVPDLVPACPRCGALDPTVCGGDELILESIEYRG